MSTVSINRQIMVEMLMHHVLGDSKTFEDTCKQRGVTTSEALHQAIKNWIGPELVVTNEQPLLTSLGHLPDPSDCPSGQESHWIMLCEHDLDLLRSEQQKLISKDPEKAALVTMAIERYIQTLASLRERLVA